MFKKILFPTDFSDVANSALDFVKQLKDAGAEEVVILHVIDQSRLDALAMYPADALAMYIDKDMLQIEKAWEASAANRMSSMEDELKEAGFEVQVRVEKGIPFKAILKVEEEEDVSVIILGSHGATNIQEMLLGSVSEKVIRKARKPVLVVKR